MVTKARMLFFVSRGHGAVYVPVIPLGLGVAFFGATLLLAQHALGSSGYLLASVPLLASAGALFQARLLRFEGPEVSVRSLAARHRLDREALRFMVARESNGHGGSLYCVQLVSAGGAMVPVSVHWTRGGAQRVIERLACALKSLDPVAARAVAEGALQAGGRRR